MKSVFLVFVFFSPLSVVGEKLNLCQQLKASMKKAEDTYYDTHVANFRKIEDIRFKVLSSRDKAEKVYGKVKGDYNKAFIAYSDTVNAHYEASRASYKTLLASQRGWTKSQKDYKKARLNLQKAWSAHDKIAENFAKAVLAKGEAKKAYKKMKTRHYQSCNSSALTN